MLGMLESAWHFCVGYVVVCLCCCVVYVLVCICCVVYDLVCLCCVAMLVMLESAYVLFYYVVVCVVLLNWLCWNLHVLHCCVSLLESACIMLFC